MIARSLVEKGAAVNAKNFRGDTSLSLASARGNNLSQSDNITFG